MKKNKEPLFLAFSDHHMAYWKQFNDNGQRLLNSGIIPLQKIWGEAGVLDVPTLFCGDLVDHPAYMDNKVMYALSACIKWHMCTYTVGINGNHDLINQSSYKNCSSGYFTSLSMMNENIKCVDNAFFDIPHTNLRIHGIPYFHGDEGFVDSLKDRVKEIDPKRDNILLIHRDLAGAVEPTGEVLPKNKEQDKALKKYFKKFKLVLSGHIHKGQKIKALGKNVHMLGATNQQRRSDAGTTCGYWCVYTDFSMEFVPLNTPEFRYYKEGEEIDDYHFWIKLPEEIKPDEETERGNEAFSVDSDRADMVDAYLSAKGISDKGKRKMALKYLNV